MVWDEITVTHEKQRRFPFISKLILNKLSYICLAPAPFKTDSKYVENPIIPSKLASSFSSFLIPVCFSPTQFNFLLRSFSSSHRLNFCESTVTLIILSAFVKLLPVFHCHAVLLHV